MSQRGRGGAWTEEREARNERPSDEGRRRDDTERQVPFYCPYCGDQDLRPDGATGGSWRCASCARAFELRFAGVVHAGQVIP